MSAAEEIQQEMQPNMVADRLAGVEGMLKNEKVKLPDDVLKNAIKGIKNIREKLEKRLPVYESDFDFVEELNEVVGIGLQYNEAMKDLENGDLYNPKRYLKKSFLHHFVPRGDNLVREVIARVDEYLISKDKKPPTSQEVIDIIMNKLTPDQKYVIGQMKNPILLIKPITTHERFVRYVTSSHILPVDMVELCKSYEKKTAIKRNITGWQIGFVEGLQDLGPNKLRCEYVDDRWQDGILAKKGATLITLNEYMLLVGRSMRKGTPIDCGDVRSIVRMEGKKEATWGDETFLAGTLHKDKPLLMRLSPKGDVGDRFRYAMMIDV